MAQQHFHVEWTDVARRDLLEIADYLFDASPAVAFSTLDHLEERATSLTQHPHRGRLVPEVSRFEVRHYRELVSDVYRLIYRVVNDTVFVLGVFDSRRNLEDVILKRLLSF